MQTELPMQNDQKHPSFATRLVLGLLFAAAGVLPILAAFDVGPLQQKDINGPPWLGVVAGSLFVLGGIFLMAGEKARDHPLAGVLVFAVIAGLAAIGNWIAFGPGPRACGAAFFTGIFTSSRAGGDLECRIAFGIGALIMNGILVWMLAAGLRRIMGPGPVLDRMERIGQGFLLLALAPILLPMLIFLAGKSLFEAVAHYMGTGQWPRNESFVARMKRKKDPPT
jgi:hypothetical protein